MTDVSVSPTGATMRSEFTLWLEKGDVFRLNTGLPGQPIIVIQRPKMPIVNKIMFSRSSNIAPTADEVAVAEAFAIAVAQAATAIRREHDEHTRWLREVRRAGPPTTLGARTGGQDGT